MSRKVRPEQEAQPRPECKRCLGVLLYTKGMQRRGEEPRCYGYLGKFKNDITDAEIDEFLENGEQLDKDMPLSSFFVGSSWYSKDLLPDGHTPQIYSGLMYTRESQRRRDRDRPMENDRERTTRPFRRSRQENYPVKHEAPKELGAPAPPNTGEFEGGSPNPTERAEPPQPLIKIRDWEDGKKHLKANVAMIATKFPATFIKHASANVTAMREMPARMASVASRMATYTTDTIVPAIKKALEEDGKRGDEERKK